MAKKTDIEKFMDLGDEFFTLGAPEELKIWTLEHGWKEGFFKKRNLQISTVSVKSSKTVGKNTTERFSKKNRLFLPNGFEIIEGSTGLTAQNKTASYPNLKVDGIKEFNDVMKHLSVKEDMKNWIVWAFSFWNPRLSAKIYFNTFKPNGRPFSDVYLSRVWDDGGEREYRIINPFEQQEFCNHSSEEIATCKMIKTMKATCAVIAWSEFEERHEDIK